MTLNRLKLKGMISAIVTIIFAIALTSCQSVQALTVTESDGIYETRSLHSPDGIGKFYMGREIAKVMGHEAAAWLERDDRATSENPRTAIASLGLQPADVVADIGAGTGYFTFRISPLVPDGKVLAADVQPEMLELMQFVIDREQITNVEPILSAPDDPHLPESAVDLALMVDAYHEFKYPREMMEKITESLKPGGRVALVEYRRENPFILIKGLHKMTEKQAVKEMEAVGLQWVETLETLPQQHLMIFQKPGDRNTRTMLK
ncbi:class I SAM-dependent methyltransferase [Lyngbya sp. CCY1209]|uniref:class I SAM-dependent methyltransferase n=1 Tax=Lyngbya sp. CCY1209 TaxID=2886103 RepID=UPI002D202E21|nr:class I SAM-dependent methyltransferase [Lyngbya sp. CCY1209]MEB3885034.1 class I SAM-dependent methyltransferase [Lyngbya sp. CCY1209]